MIAPLIHIGYTIVTRKLPTSDCVKYDVTFTGYVGEIWKYLLAQSTRDTDRQHKVKMVIGNGLRSNLVPLVKERFGWCY